MLIIGGSQGAKAIDLAMLSSLEFLKGNGLECWHQCREESVSALESGYKDAGVKAKVVPFIENIVEAYRWAEIIVSRSGAGAVMEIGVVNIPTIFVPYPFAQGNHQVTNAKVLVDSGKALLVEEGPGFEERLREAIACLLDVEFYTAMRNRPVDDRSRDAAEKIAEGCLQLINH